MIFELYGGILNEENCCTALPACKRILHGSGCLRALNEKTGAFERYGDETLQAAAVFTCNGCGENKLPNQEGINKKIERIIKMQPDALHLSNCTMPKDENGNRVICPVIKELEDKFTAAGIDVVRGTH